MVVEKCFNYHRYSLMKSCWTLMSMSRPTFADLVQQLSGYLECLASYVILSDDVNGCSKDVEVGYSEDSYYY